MTLLGLAIKGTAVLLAAALAARALRRAPAAWRYAAWTAAFASLVTLPVLTVFGPTWRMAILPTTAQASGPSVAPSTLVAWIGAGWAIGAFAVAVRWIVAHVAARRLVRRAVPVGGARWRRAEAQARAAIGLRVPVRLLRSPRLETPAAWGVRPSRQAVLLPRSAQAWTDQRRRAVLLHEMAHLRRGDLLTQIIAQAAVAVHWFNPFVWRAYRTALVERELACDDAALRAGADAADYAGHLLALARILRPPNPAMAAMVSRTALETRIVSILTPGHARGPSSRASTSATAALALAIAFGVASVDVVPKHAVPVLAVARLAPVSLPEPAALPVPVADLAHIAPAVIIPTVPPGDDAPDGPEPASPPTALTASAPPHPVTPVVSPAPAATRAVARTAAPYVPLAFKSVDPDEISRQVVQLRATVAALHDLNPASLSCVTIDEALAAVPDLTDADRLALHADALADLRSATAAAEQRLWEAETAFERDMRGARGARGPSF